ncbi:MAG: hypothetical protein ACRDNF_03920 [Streptosporangiaceae bacterium]
MPPIVPDTRGAVAFLELPRGHRQPPRLPAPTRTGRSHHQLARLLRYLTGYLSGNDADTVTLCRIQYLGHPDQWAFAIWQASSDTYADSVLLDGQPTGHPNQALDTACTLYLASTDDQPAEPLKDLRGAALGVSAPAGAGTAQRPRSIHDEHGQHRE